MSEYNYQEDHQSITGNYSWVPFHVVTCSSEEHGFGVDNLSDQPARAHRAYESQRLGDFPVEIVIRFHYRVELDYIIISSSQQKTIPGLEVQIGDGLAGDYNAVEYRVAGEYGSISSAPLQIKCYGIGSFMKLVIKDRPGRSAENPYSQIAIAHFRVWGRLTGYETKLENAAIPIKSDKVRMNKILLEMGVPSDIFNFYEEGNNDVNNLPIDDATKITVCDLRAMRDDFINKEDFEGLRQISKDLKKVTKIGRTIFSYQKELEFALIRQDYDKAIEMKELIKKEGLKRDKFDALYETSRYESMIQMKRPNTADFNNSVYYGDAHLDKFNRDEEMNEVIELERTRLGKSGLRDETILTENSRMQTPRSILKNSYDNVKKLQFNEEEVDESRFAKPNPLERNQGDEDLELYFKPLITEARDRIPDLGVEQLNRLHRLGLLEIFGADVWKAIHASSWRVRRAAAQAVLNYIEMPLNAKYIGKSKNLFLACVEIARMISNDRILEIYFLGLKILSTCLAPPICGEDVHPSIVNKVLVEFVPILVKKISELNYKARDVSMHTLISLFKHQAADIYVLIDNCLDLCETEKDYVLYGKSQKIPIEKQQAMPLLARLEIVLQALAEFGYDETKWNYREPFDLLLVPCFFHPSIEVRQVAIELGLMFYQLIGEEVRQAIFSIKDLKPQIFEQLSIRMEELQDIVAQNTGDKNSQKLEEIREEDSGEDDDEPLRSKKKSIIAPVTLVESVMVPKDPALEENKSQKSSRSIKSKKSVKSKNSKGSKASKKDSEPKKDGDSKKSRASSKSKRSNSKKSSSKKKSKK